VIKNWTVGRPGNEANTNTETWPEEKMFVDDHLFVSDHIAQQKIPA